MPTVHHGPKLNQDRLRHWWLERLPRSDTLLLTQRNVYILPTAAGWMWVATLLVLLIASINYQLNLGYLLTFLLAGSAVVATHLTHNNLRGLQGHLRPGMPVFAGQTAQVEVTLHNPNRRIRYAIGLHWLISPSPGSSPSELLIDTPPQATTTVLVGYPTQTRGLIPLPALKLETRFPIGIFRVWSWWRPAASQWVYPTPESAPPPWPRGPNTTDEPAHRSGPPSPVNSDTPDGVRPWRRGDPLKWVVWKKVAKTWANGKDEWVSRDWGPTHSTELWFDLAQTGLNDAEAQRARLCAWVLQADEQGITYGLRLPALDIPPSQGPAHRQLCLEALACN